MAFGTHFCFLRSLTYFLNENVPSPHDCKLIMQTLSSEGFETMDSSRRESPGSGVGCAGLLSSQCFPLTLRVLHLWPSLSFPVIVMVFAGPVY